MNKLLTRDQFRNAVFERDKITCVICKDTSAHDAHHIMERRLFSDGGYYLNNGASLCDCCHLKAEQTLITVEEIRAAVGIDDKDKVVPAHLDSSQSYDKWGNPILANGSRMRGELFDDPNVQKVLDSANVLASFTKYVKYPRTPHLSYSQGINGDDIVCKPHEIFTGRKVVITLKMDGENTTLYNDYIHARSIHSKYHWSRTWIKNFHANIASLIDDDMRVVVENLYATHSIEYTDLINYCYGLSVWKNLRCLSWDQTLDVLEILEIPHAPVIYQGMYNDQVILDIIDNLDLTKNEGFVVRAFDEFHYKNFNKNVAKFVRANHIQTDEHWINSPDKKVNKLYEA